MNWRPILDRRGSRAARLVALALLGIPLAVAAARLLPPLAGRALVGMVEALMAACVWVAMSLSVGVSVWTLLGTVGRAAGAAVLTRRASLVFGALVLVGALAAYGLQRLLGSEEESSQ